MSGNETKFAHGPIWEARVRDALSWVAQEARGAVMNGLPLHPASRLREALTALENAYGASFEE